jgi:outer membrane biosynthesis protein TonB
MLARPVIMAAAVLVVALAWGACGRNDDTSKLRAEVSALQTQLASPSVTPAPSATSTTNPAPTPTVAPEPTPFPTQAPPPPAEPTLAGSARITNAEPAATPAPVATAAPAVVPTPAPPPPPAPAATPTELPPTATPPPAVATRSPAILAFGRCLELWTQAAALESTISLDPDNTFLKQQLTATKQAGASCEGVGATAGADPSARNYCSDARMKAAALQALAALESPATWGTTSALSALSQFIARAC